MQLRVYDLAGEPLGMAEVTRGHGGRYYADEALVASVTEQCELTTLSVTDGRTLRVASADFERLASEGETPSPYSREHIG